MSDLDFEKVPGLPSELPPGETLLWQGRPQWRSLARRTFKLNWLIAYLTAFVALRLVTGLQHGEGVKAFVAAAQAAGLAALCTGVVLLLAWGYARVTLYSITSERIVMRIGVAIPITVNLPFRRIASADLQASATEGDIVLQLASGGGIAWLHLWPHTQTRFVSKPRPTLLSLARPAEVATLLGKAVEAWSGRRGAAVMLGSTELTAANDSAPGQLAAGIGH